MPIVMRVLAGAVVAVAWGVTGLGALARDGATQILDNARVTVWEVVSVAKPPAKAPANLLDTCSIALTAGPIRRVGADGSSVTLERQIGDVVFERRGAGHVDVAKDAKSIVIEFKDASVPALVNRSGYPNAFPRPGSKNVLENNRIVAWDYTWTPGQPTPMHFHDKDVVVVYLETGELLSTALDGQQVNNPHYFGFTKFNARDRTHTETLVKGKGRAIIVELR